MIRTETPTGCARQINVIFDSNIFHLSIFDASTTAAKRNIADAITIPYNRSCNCFPLPSFASIPHITLPKMSTSTLLAESTNKRKSSEDSEDAAGKKTTTTTEPTTTKSPYDAYMEKMNAFMTEKDCIGSLLVKGIGPDPRRADNDDDDDDDDDDEDDDEDEDDDDEQDNDTITQEQLDCLRFILITQNRADKLEEMQSLILGDQKGASMMMFNTSFSYDVQDSLEMLKSLLKKQKTPAQKLDLLLAYTHTVKEYDVWMHDNEGGMGDFTKGLAAIWKRLLKGTDEDLGIDAEFTKPALEEFLKQFKTMVESVEGYDDEGMKFKYK
jgi:hypothetical protein